MTSLATKVVGLRIFEDDHGTMNRSLVDVGRSVLCVSQFTLYGDVRRGRRPSFDESAPSDEARPIYEAFCAAVEAGGLACQRGEFGAWMQVALVNDGPVTFIPDSDAMSLPRRA